LDNIKAGIEQDNVSNQLKGEDETHSIATLSRMFQALAQQVKDNTTNGSNDDEESTIAIKKAQQQNSILDELPLAQ
jgi:hypothetical protein